VLDHYLEFVLAHQESDGGFPYLPSGGSVLESTAFCLLALENYGRAKEAIDRGFAYLLSLQNKTGGWFLFRNDTRSSAYATALSLLVLKRLGQSKHQDRIEHGVRSLEKVRRYVRDETMDEAVWGWNDQTFIGPEPTAVVALALKHIHSLSEYRAKEVERFFKDNMCNLGGWTYGYPVDREKRGEAVLARALLVPQLHVTALVLLCMQDKKDEYIHHFRILRELYPQSYCPLSLSLAALAFDCYRFDSSDVIRRLNTIMTEDPLVAPVVFYNALAALANLTGMGRNPLCLDR
jgi:hypothetical protein